MVGTVRQSGSNLQVDRQGGSPPEAPIADEFSGEGASDSNELLILVSAPLVTEDFSPVEGLAIQREVDEIVSVLENLPVLLGIKVTVKIATTENLLAAFSNQFAPKVIHFIGHGMQTEQGIALMLEDAVGRARSLSVAELKDLLRPRTEPPCTLAVLNACHSEGLATAFLEAGVSHVIAVNTADQILDTAARCFARQFYQAVFNCYPVIDAFLQGRTAVKADDELTRLINSETWKPDVAVTEAIKFQLLPGNSRVHQDPLQLQQLSGRVRAPQWTNTNLLNDDPAFVGRRVDIHRIAVDLAPGSTHRCIALHGMGGMGKTALALAVGRWQHERQRWQAGVWVVKLRGVATISEAIARIQDALELKLTSFSVAKLVQVLTNQSRLLILDDLDALLEQDESGLIELLNALSGCRRLGLLITSRLALPQEVFYQQREVQGMGDDALQVFKRYAPPVEQWGMDTTQSDVEQLLRILDGYPFPIRLAAAYMKATRCTLRELREVLQISSSDTLRPISRRETRDNSLVATLEISYQILPPDARRIFALLSLFPGGLTPELVEVATGKDGRTAIAVLLEFSMAEQPEGSTSLRITLPEPARQYAEEKLEASVNDVMLRVLEYFYDLVRQVQTSSAPDQMNTESQILQDERVNLNRYIHWGYGQENKSQNICYSARLTTLLMKQWQWVSPGEDRLESLYLAQIAAERCQDLIGQAEVQKAIGDIHVETEGLQIAQSTYELSVQYYQTAIQRLTVPLEVAALQCKIGEIWQLCQQVHQAIASYQNAFEIYQAEGEQLQAAESQMRIGQIHEVSDHFDDAISCYRYANKLYATANNLAGIAKAVVSTQRIHMLLDSSPFEFVTVTVDSQGEIVKKIKGSARHFTERLPGRIRSITKKIFGQIPLELIMIPDGTFTMGSPKNELGHDSHEEPYHAVAVPPFFIGRYPVTQAQWEVVAGMPQIGRKLKPDPSGFKGDNCPVERVSWYDAVEFCQRLSQHTGRDYRLPTEAEWEYACRAGTTTPFHFGETITTDVANYRGTDDESVGWSGSYGDGPKGEYREKTTPVNQFEGANAFGLVDMHGNVWEWCQDKWYDSYEGAPNDGSAWIDSNSTNNRVLRGGSWVNCPRNCRSAFRLRLGADVDFNHIGFRVVCSAPRILL